MSWARGGQVLEHGGYRYQKISKGVLLFTRNAGEPTVRTLGRKIYFTLIDYWLIDCCLTSSVNYFMHIQDESILMNNDDERSLLCTRPTRWDGFSTCQLTKATVCRKTFHFTKTHYSDLADQSFLLLPNVACLAEKQ